MVLTCLCLDPSLTGCGFAAMPVPLIPDAHGYHSLAANVLGGIAGVIDNKDAREIEQVRIVRLYDELYAALGLMIKKGHRPHLIAAEMAPHLYSGTQKHEKAIRFQFAAYTVIRLFAHHVNLPLLECAPEKSKQASVGFAKADKEAVKRGLAFRCLGHADTKWPPGYTEDVLDALTVGFWLDALYQSSRMGEVTALTPLMPREELAIPT